MHIRIIIHVLQNGTRWLPFITVVEDNIYIFFNILVNMNLIGTLGHPVSVTHKLPASQDSKQLRHTRNSPKNACVQAKRYVLCR